MKIKTYVGVPKYVDAMEWDSKLPYFSFRDLVIWAGMSGPFFLDGLDRGEQPSGLLVIRGQNAARNGDFIVRKASGEFEIIDRATFQKEFLPCPESILAGEANLRLIPLEATHATEMDTPEKEKENIPRINRTLRRPEDRL